MLAEIRSEAFRIKRVQFHAGLNVVLGDDNATNSIGKSTLLMVIDFAFGGSALMRHNTDLVHELGHHDYESIFSFDGELYRFRRGTFEPGVVHQLGEDGNVEEVLSLEEYTAFLKASYKVALPDLSFRTLISLYTRVWGKENLNVHRPLHVVPTQSGKLCVENLIKTFGRYDAIRQIAEALSAAEARRSAFNAAVKNQLLPKIGKRHYDANESKIEQLEGELNAIRVDLAKYATNLSEVVDREVLQLKAERDQLSELKLGLASKLSRTQRNISGNRHIRSKHFESLREFVPEVDQDRLAQVEEFHSELARLLRAELRESETRLKEQIADIDAAIAEIDAQMSATLGAVEQPSLLVDRVYNLAIDLRDARKENEHFETAQDLKETVRELQQRLSDQKVRVLDVIEKTINDGIRRIVARVFGPDRKSPHIELGEANYSYTVHEDTGTGTAYASLIVLDLTIFQATPLPIVVHDSLLFKNVENDSVARLLHVYEGVKKQSFIAIDEIKKYGPATTDFLRDRSVIQLSNNAVLYVKDWRQTVASAVDAA